MDHPYQTTMQLPAAYAVISEEEMTYLEGGAEIVLAQAFGHQLTLDTQEFASFCASLMVNAVYYAMNASFSYVTGILQSGHRNGLTLGGTVTHAWNKLETPWSKIASIGAVGLAGFYAYAQVRSVVLTLKNLYDAVVNPMPDFTVATTETAAA